MSTIVPGACATHGATDCTSRHALTRKPGAHRVPVDPARRAFILTYGPVARRVNLDGHHTMVGRDVRALHLFGRHQDDAHRVSVSPIVGRRVIVRTSR